MLKVINLSKSYDETKALRNVSFEILRGEIIGVVGKNGAGNTTLLETIAGLTSPSEGEVQVEDIMDYSAESIAYLEDDPYFYEHLTLMEAIIYFHLMQNLKISKDGAYSMLTEYGLAEKSDMKIRNLSRGMKQLFGFLLTTIKEPAIILMDEPFTGLDPSNMSMMKSKLTALSDEGKLILISTHILSFASHICNRILFMDQGEIKYISENEELQSEEMLQRKFNELIT